MTEADIVIIGAGAAGVGAARRIAGSDKSVLVVEASSRIGGRAWTMTVDGMPLDLGCGWLHSAKRNPWVDIGQGAGFTIDRTPSAWGRQFRNLGFSNAEQEAAGAAYDAFEQRLRHDPPASDRAFDAMEDGCEWNPFIEALSGYINGVGLRMLSIADYLAYDDTAGAEDWRVAEGYGTLISAALPPVPVALSTPVTRVDHRGTGVRIETARGAVTCKAVIITVSTSILARGDITFAPSLDAHLHAASKLPLGLANKLFLSLDHADDIEPDSHLLGDPRNAETGSYYLRPFGLPTIECFFGGEGARDLEASGLDGASAFAKRELCALFGSEFGKRLHLVTGSAWGRADHIGGSYSHACPGHAEARAVLALPVDDRLFFAGEACSPADFSTAHGALATGIAAAEAALSALG